MKILSGVKETINKLDISSISEERKAVLQPLIDYIYQKKKGDAKIVLMFVCTHNSRRSHLAQIWSQSIAYYLGLEIWAYSSGTEATAMYPVVVDTLRDKGFEIDKLSDDTNPVYAIRFSSFEPPIFGFSKTIDDDYNPISHFGAVMTCSQAEEDCPYVLGADIRVPITYDDPKAFDDTPLQREKYEERSTQIATEMLYVLDSVINHN